MPPPLFAGRRTPARSAFRRRGFWRLPKAGLRPAWFGVAAGKGFHGEDFAVAEIVLRIDIKPVVRCIRHPGDVTTPQSLRDRGVWFVTESLGGSGYFFLALRTSAKESKHLAQIATPG